jgi:hypothetical protein
MINPPISSCRSELTVQSRLTVRLRSRFVNTL